MQRNIWMRPALQTSEAVMLPALQRRMVGEPQFSDLYYRAQPQDNVFQPVQADRATGTATAPTAIATTPVTTTALSTYVRPRGSMGGRSVLRAAGVSLNPFIGNMRPVFFQSNGGNRGFSMRGFF